MTEKEIINMIVRVRKEKKLSQKELADLLGITQSEYSKYETQDRRIPINNLITIFDCLGIKIKVDFVSA